MSESSRPDDVDIDEQGKDSFPASDPPSTTPRPGPDEEPARRNDENDSEDATGKPGGDTP
ncbi:MAG TPA: hypothetical protein VHX66_14630 [Solirubrobacteraceae bacterium]|jgi:hypothetical protein|nr:hypothetical protein [Solirubrobacteraceae bacterium]